MGSFGPSAQFPRTYQLHSQTIEQDVQSQVYVPEEMSFKIYIFYAETIISLGTFY